jgi:hypothetical protein
MRPTILALATGSVLAACAPRATAPPSPAGAPSGSRSVPVDTQRISRDARSDQHRFERLRRGHLPYTYLAAPRRCDEVVGRFCLWHDDEDERWTARPESDAIRRGRERLLGELERAAVDAPADPWIAGQRVRYLVEAGRHEDAVTIARACRAVPDWWCPALEGFALHAAAAFPAADSAFSRALAAMPEAERCRWSDVAVLIDDARVRAAYAGTPCPARDSVERRFWWLADPLYLVPGNDHRTEHYARLVLDALQRRAESGFGLRWGEDLRELLLRYGWPAGWERDARRTSTLLEDGSIVGHHPPGARTLAPPRAALERPTAFAPGDWSLDPARPRSTHLPPYAVAFDALEHQLAVFRRGDSSVVVAAWDAADSLPAGSTVEAALVLAPDERTQPLVARSPGGPRGAAVATVRATPLLVSVEALARGERRAARARYGLTLAPLAAGTFAISDLLLFHPQDSLPDSLAVAARDALGSLRVRSGERVGVYWEVYGLGGRDDQLSITVTLVREGKSWLRRTFEWAGLARDRSRRAHLEWAEQPRTDGALLPRAVTLDLADVQPGVYRLAVEARRAGGEAARAERTVVVRE